MVEFEMKNGTVECTLTFARLYQLRTKHKKEYNRYFEIENEGIKTDLDAVEEIYVAYLCANMEKMPDVMSFEEFLNNCKNGRPRVWQTINALKGDEKN